MVVCPCCFASTSNTAPHGIGEPCPYAVILHAAEVRERDAHTALLIAQREATVAGASSRRLRS